MLVARLRIVASPSTQSLRCQIIQVRALLLGGFGGEGLAVALDVVELQPMQLRIQLRLVTRGHDDLPGRR